MEDPKICCNCGALCDPVTGICLVCGKHNYMFDDVILEKTSGLYNFKIRLEDNTVVRLRFLSNPQIICENGQMSLVFPFMCMDDKEQLYCKIENCS